MSKFRTKSIKIIKILSSKYRLFFTRNLKDKNSKLYGKASLDHAKIKIFDAYPAMRQNQTIVHEVLHAITDEVGIELPEMTIEKMGGGFYAFLIDNKKLIRKILKEEAV